MKLLCDGCGEVEDIVLLPYPYDNLMQFECGEVSEITKEDLDELFRKWGGER